MEALPLGDATNNKNRRERSFKRSCLQWSGAATFPGKLLPECQASTLMHQSQSLPLHAHGMGSSELPSPQMKSENHGHNHPQEEDKGQPGLHKSPYAAKQDRGEVFKHGKLVEKAKRELPASIQAETSTF